jgi:hypothetical protein
MERAFHRSEMRGIRQWDFSKDIETTDDLLKLHGLTGCTCEAIRQ